MIRTTKEHHRVVRGFPRVSTVSIVSNPKGLMGTLYRQGQWGDRDRRLGIIIWKLKMRDAQPNSKDLAEGTQLLWRRGDRRAATLGDGCRTSTRVAAGSAGRGSARDRRRSCDAASRLADRNAPLPSARRRVMKTEEQFAQQANSAAVVLRGRRQAWRRSRFHQEDAQDAGRRYRVGPAANEGDDHMKGTKRKNPHWGSRLENFLDEEGIRESAKAAAITRVVAWQLAEEMKRQGISKTASRPAHAHKPRAGGPNSQSQRQRDCDATASCGPCWPGREARKHPATASETPITLRAAVTAMRYFLTGVW